MNRLYAEIVRRHCRPLEPLPSGAEPRLRALPRVRAVLFDLYGTLFVSGDGGRDASAEASEAAFREALAGAGLELAGEAAGLATFRAVLEQDRERRRAAGVAWPEVRIEEVWEETLAALAARRWLGGNPRGVDLRRLAVDYECRINPVWPMPGCAECLAALRAKGLRLGVVSNSQFYTLELFPALLDATPAELGFDAGLQFYSYRLGRAKPGTFLYRRAAEALEGLGIAAREVLHVGNDPVNDVEPAARCGFRTAIFAGDGRSRHDAGEAAAPAPDLVLTHLGQLAGCLGGQRTTGS